MRCRTRPDGHHPPTMIDLTLYMEGTTRFTICVGRFVSKNRAWAARRCWTGLLLPEASRSEEEPSPTSSGTGFSSAKSNTGVRSCPRSSRRSSTEPCSRRFRKNYLPASPTRPWAGKSPTTLVSRHVRFGPELPFLDHRRVAIGMQREVQADWFSDPRGCRGVLEAMVRNRTKTRSHRRRGRRWPEDATANRMRRRA
jgi:hypothetical protein